MMEFDKKLSDAAVSFPDRNEFKPGQLVKQKPGLRYVKAGETDEEYTGHFAFVQWINAMVGNDDNPMHPNNLLIADCIVMAYNGRGWFCPVLMDSRFIEPAVQVTEVSDETLPL